MKIALDSQMPNLNNSIDMIAEKLDEREWEDWYSSGDMTHAYEQIPLHEVTKRQCNLQIVGGNLSPFYDWILWTYSNALRISENDGPHTSEYK